MGRNSWTAGALPARTPSSRKKALQEISGVSGLGDASGFDDARVDGECEEGRPERILLLDLPLAGGLRGANQ